MDPRMSTRFAIAAALAAVVGVIAWVVFLLTRPSPHPQSGEADSGAPIGRLSHGNQPGQAPRPGRPQHEDRGAPAPSRRAAADGALVGRAVDSETGEALPGASAVAIATSTLSKEGGTPRRRSEPGTGPGEFEFEALPAGTFRVTVRAPNFLPQTVEQIVVPAGDAKDLGDVALDRGSFVTGAVVDAADNSPVVGAVVRLERGEGPADHGAVPRSTSDDRGRFSLGPLRSGPAALRVTRPGFQILHLPEVQAPPRGLRDLGRVPLQRRAGAALSPEIGPAGPGIGIAPSEGRYVVRVVAPGSPAADAGVPEGATILSIANYPTEDLSPDDALALLQGEAGSRATLQLAHPDWPEPRNFAIHRR